jgi:hypothetical protein
VTVKRVTFESPYGCRWCGIQQRHHGRRYKLPIGTHAWEAPWPQIILKRMRQRRAARLNAEPATLHATTGWSVAPDGESADPYCADCGRSCPRWNRIQDRLDQQRFGLPRRTRRTRKTADAGAGWGGESWPF